jgi:hypothetical protein
MTEIVVGDPRLANFMKSVELVKQHTKRGNNRIPPSMRCNMGDIQSPFSRRDITRISANFARPILFVIRLDTYQVNPLSGTVSF